MHELLLQLAHIKAIKLSHTKIDDYELNFPEGTFHAKLDGEIEDILLTYLSAIILHTIPPTFDPDECEKLIKRVYLVGYHLGNQATAETEQGEQEESG